MPSSETPVVVRRATLDEIHALRCEILRPAQAPMNLQFPGDDGVPPGTWHFGAFAGTRNIGCLTLLAAPWQDQPALQLRGMAVARDRQGLGVGTRLLLAAAAVLADAADAPALWWCNARVGAIRFYERNGWRVESEEFMITSVGLHKKMVRITR